MILATEWMSWFAAMDNRAQTISVAIAGASLCVISGLLIGAWRRVRQSEHRAQIIGQLLARGFTAEDITRVLAASDLVERREDAAAQNAKAGADPEVHIVRALTDQSYSADDINRILAAARVAGRIDPAVVDIVKSLADSWSDAGNIVAVLDERRRGSVSPGSPDDRIQART